MPSITKAHHMGLQVADLERSVAFYRDVLGFEVAFAWNPQADYIRELVGYPTADIHAAILRLPGTEVMLELLEYRNVERTPVDTSTANPGTAHIAFFVDDLDVAVRRPRRAWRPVRLAPGHPDDRAERGRAGGLPDRSRRDPGRAHPDPPLVRRIRGHRERRGSRGRCGPWLTSVPTSRGPADRSRACG